MFRPRSCRVSLRFVVLEVR
ncbi:hypothetical protein E2C01_101579 [Portunus trituberculatus]|uniref:Uncharacterized protein n=1 Tax=Portunus trituberculatus TaxID=210409 RepID=A0A5B7K9Z0_PORTR|nr:hypothetical protein [Portunus trituberculatus]